MLKFAVIGYPLTQSLSAIMHNAMLKDLNLDGNYELLETDSEDLVTRIKQLKSQNYTGFNVTIPNKVPITLFLDEVDKQADIAGCANTVKIMPDKSLYGYNTDIYGFQAAISEEIKQKIKNKTVTILGTGGAARAAAIALCEIGVKTINFFARNIINASDMVNFLRNQFPEIIFNLKQIQSIKDLSDTSMLINSTPIGMRGKAMGTSPIDESIIKTLPQDATVYDIIYNPLKTELLNLAQKNGYNTISGLDMFVHQGAKAFEIWTGHKAKPEIMKIAVLEALAQL
jgi:shikimate dehydrogenase